MLTEWAYNGGVFIGVNAPSAVGGYDTFFRMSHVLGVDKDTGAKICHGRYTFDVSDENGLIKTDFKSDSSVYLTDGTTKVLAADGDAPAVTVHDFGKGKGVYFSTFKHSDEAARTLLEVILDSCGETDGAYMTDNLYTECAYYPADKKLVIINNSPKKQKTAVKLRRNRRCIHDR